MICTICYAIRNNNKWRGELVSLMIYEDKVMCHSCVSKAMAEAQC